MCAYCGTRVEWQNGAVVAAPAEPHAEPDPRVTTWADGNEVWHARVPSTCVSPLIAARRALRDELNARAPVNLPVPQDIWMHPVRRPELDTEGTWVYREGNSL